MRQPVNLSIEETIWKEFKKSCIDKDIDASSRIENFMDDELKKELNNKLNDGT